MALTLLRRNRGTAKFLKAERHLRSTQIELETLRRRGAGSEAEHHAAALLDEAVAALQQRRIEHCWHFVNAARRELVSMRDDAERSIAAKVLLIEVEKLSAWRRRGIEAALADPVPAPAAMAQALWLRDDFYETRYHRVDMQREQLGTIVLTSLGTLAAIVGLSAFTGTGLMDTLPASEWEGSLLMFVLAFGVLGGSLSAARTITVKDLHTLVPELELGRWITFARMVLGAALGLAAYTFLQSGFFNTAVAPRTFAQAASIAFAGGFSEQLVLKALGRFGGRDEKPAS